MTRDVGLPFGYWHPSLPDKRDYYLAEEFTTPLLPHVDFRTHYIPPILVQGVLGSCTSCAAQYLLQYIQYLQSLGAYQPPRYATLFHYYFARYLEGTVPVDVGTSMRSVFKAMRQFGVCLESYWPYRAQAVATKPAIMARQLADTTIVQKYLRVQQTREGMQRCLQQRPFVIGLTLYDSFFSDAVARTGAVSLPNLVTETAQGGHAVCIVGYDTARDVYYALTSFGENWGDGGCLMLPCAYAEDADLASDAWTLEARYADA